MNGGGPIAKKAQGRRGTLETGKGGVQRKINITRKKVLPETGKKLPKKDSKKRGVKI